MTRHVVLQTGADVGGRRDDRVALDALRALRLADRAPHPLHDAGEAEVAVGGARHDGAHVDGGRVAGACEELDGRAAAQPATLGQVVQLEPPRRLHQRNTNGGVKTDKALYANMNNLSTAGANVKNIMYKYRIPVDVMYSNTYTRVANYIRRMHHNSINSIDIILASVLSECIKVKTKEKCT